MNHVCEGGNSLKGPSKTVETVPWLWSFQQLEDNRETMPL